MVREYLRELRKKAGMTQADVARKLNVGVTTYGMIESGERQKDMNISLVQKLSEIFGISIEDILKMENEK